MKKFFKVLGIILLSLIIIIGALAYYFRGQIGFYINIVKEYLEFKENPPSIEELKDCLLYTSDAADDRPQV